MVVLYLGVCMYHISIYGYLVCYEVYRCKLVGGEWGVTNGLHAVGKLSDGAASDNLLRHTGLPVMPKVESLVTRSYTFGISEYY